MLSHFVTLLFIASMASYQVNAATTIDTFTPAKYGLTDNLEVTFVIDVVKGTFTITYGASGSGDDVGTFDVAAGTFTDDSGKPADIAVDVATEKKITVKKSNLATTDDGKLIQLVYDDAGDDTTNDADQNKNYEVKLTCPAVTGNVNVKSSSTGNSCDQANYRYGTCVTVFDCVDGYYAADVTSICTVGAWETPLPTCDGPTFTVSSSPAEYFVGGSILISAGLSTVGNGKVTITYGGESVSEVTISGSSLTKRDATTAVTNVSIDITTANTIKLNKTFLVKEDEGKEVKFDHDGSTVQDATYTLGLTVSCEKIPSPANGTSSCAASNTKVGSECTITCDEGTVLSGSTPVTCETDTGVIGKWSNTTDTYSCDAISGAGMIALNMMLALVLGAISSFMM